MMKKCFISLAVAMAALAVTSCSSDNDDNGSYNKFSDKTFGQNAVVGCSDLGDELIAANNAISTTSLTTAQETFLKEKVFPNIVNNVIIPTYTRLADATEDLEKTLHGLTIDNITQEKIDRACEDFKTAREQWELSEAFLGGAASDFSIDPTIDSWPLSRTNLLNYFNGSLSLDDADESILGFHALEFMLFRDGKNRKVSDFKSNDTYPGFEKISGAKELRYAQEVCTLLKQRTFQLQVAWEGENSANATRAQVLKDAGLSYLTPKNISYGENLIKAGSSVSTFATVKDAVEQLLAAEEGSAFAITNEVGTAKIAHPFSEGIISYVESPYSYNSIVDFQNNIRSVRNVWYGSTDGNAAQNSFATFFSETKPATNSAVVNAFNNAISAIGSMPYPFVKYCTTVWNKNFSEEEFEGEE